jgi:hypothetical protein
MWDNAKADGKVQCHVWTLWRQGYGRPVHMTDTPVTNEYGSLVAEDLFDGMDFKMALYAHGPKESYLGWAGDGIMVADCVVVNANDSCILYMSKQ